MDETLLPTVKRKADFIARHELIKRWKVIQTSINGLLELLNSKQLRAFFYCPGKTNSCQTWKELHPTERVIAQPLDVQFAIEDDEVFPSDEYCLYCIENGEQKPIYKCLHFSFSDPGINIAEIKLMSELPDPDLTMIFLKENVEQLEQKYPEFLLLDKADTRLVELNKADSNMCAQAIDALQRENEQLKSQVESLKEQLELSSAQALQNASKLERLKADIEKSPFIKLVIEARAAKWTEQEIAAYLASYKCSQAQVGILLYPTLKYDPHKVCQVFVSDNLKPNRIPWKTLVSETQGLRSKDKEGFALKDKEKFESYLIRKKDTSYHM